MRLETTERTLRLPIDHPGEMYYAAVSIVESHGYESTRSEPLNMLFMMASDQINSETESSAHVYIAVAVAVIIVIALGASLLVLFVRHRRLQRTFVSFANSHYDTRSGAATFSDQNLGNSINLIHINHISVQSRFQMVIGSKYLCVFNLKGKKMNLISTRDE